MSTHNEDSDPKAVLTPWNPLSQMSFEGFLDLAVLTENHPMRNNGTIFPTPPLKRVMDIIIHTLALGTPGCGFIGYPRFGKTSTLSYCVERLPEAFPNRPIVSFSCRDNGRYTCREFYAQLLNQSGYICHRDRKKHPRDQLARAWALAALTRGSRRLVVFGDEMQRLSSSEFTWLADTWNDLAGNGVGMTFFSFGQPELKSLRNTFLSINRGDLIGRFLTRLFTFDGIASALELKQVFDCYDDPEQAEYPEGSHCCFTNFFLPQAYRAGWRLGSCAPMCWELFVAQTREVLGQTSGRLSIGMEYVAGVASHLLSTLNIEDRPTLSVAIQDCDAAVRSTSFVNSLGLTYHPDWVVEP